MRVLILGGNGMLGHKFFKSWQKIFATKVTLRNSLQNYKEFNLFNENNSFSNVDVRNLNELEKVFNVFQPDAVVNCIGITKQKTNIKKPADSVQVNSLFPHKLSNICKTFNSRLIILSTDCIFSGKSGNYKEEDISDAEDLYGRSKFLGEVTSKNVLTLRKSTIGLELGSHHGLIEWFLAQEGDIKGYSKTIYSGVTSEVLAKIIARIINDFPNIYGVRNIASKPISKFKLLQELNKKLPETRINVLQDDEIVCDRSLDSSKLNKEIGELVPSWDEMLEDLAKNIIERIK